LRASAQPDSERSTAYLKCGSSFIRAEEEEEEEETQCRSIACSHTETQRRRRRFNVDIVLVLNNLSAVTVPYTELACRS